MKIINHQSSIINKIDFTASGKINLFLDIFGKRADGYHELRSVVLPVSLCDTITVSAREDTVVTCRTIGEGTDVSELDSLPLEKQLAVKALRAMQRLTGIMTGADISVVKRIPIGAGMGGGSADAAGVMRAFMKLQNSAIGNHQSSIGNQQSAILSAAASIGSDVPALFLGGPVLMEGRGERVKPVGFAIPKMHLVVAFPGFAVSTKKIYEEFRVSAAPHPDDFSMRNDLEKTVFRLYPEVLKLRDSLLECGAKAAMVSGSGSAVFGVADDADHAQKIQSRLPETLWSRTVETVEA